MALIEVSEAPSEVQRAETSGREGQRDDVALVRLELDSYYAVMKTFRERELREVLSLLAAYSARASELRTRLQRTDNRIFQNLRTKEIDPFLDEVDRQFRVWSRVQSIVQLDWDMARGF